MAYFCACAQCVTILVLARNSARFQVLCSYTLLCKSPVLMHSQYIAISYMKTALSANMALLRAQTKSDI